MQKIVISGGTGFVGRALVQRLIEKQKKVLLLTRRPSTIQIHQAVEKGLGCKAAASERPERTVVVREDRERAATPQTGLYQQPVILQSWDARTLGIWVRKLEGTEAVINLCGEPIVGKRWDSAQKKRIVESRVLSTRVLVDAISRLEEQPKVFIAASAVGFYGDVAKGEVTEESPAGSDFLAETCRQWEEEAFEAEKEGIRVVTLRIGIVLEKDGGALPRMLLPFRFFMGGPLGSGEQWLSWIHREDLVGIILFCLDHPEMSGPINAVSPEPVPMKDFCKVIGRVLHRPSWAPVPAPLLRLLLGEMSSVLLAGQRVVPKKLEHYGFSFAYPSLQSALENILKK